MLVAAGAASADVFAAIAREVAQMLRPRLGWGDAVKRNTPRHSRRHEALQSNN